MAHVNEVGRRARSIRCANSWYMGANIPGKPRVFMPYVGGCRPLPADSATRSPPRATRASRSASRKRRVRPISYALSLLLTGDSILQRRLQQPRRRRRSGRCSTRCAQPTSPSPTSRCWPTTIAAIPRWRAAARISARRPGCSTSWSRRASICSRPRPTIALDYSISGLLHSIEAMEARGLSSPASAAISRMRGGPAITPVRRHRGDDLLRLVLRQGQRGGRAAARPAGTAGAQPAAFRDGARGDRAAARGCCARSPSSSGSRPSASRRSRSGFAFPPADPAVFPLGRPEVQSRPTSARCARRPPPRTSRPWCAGSRRRAGWPTWCW